MVLLTKSWNLTSNFYDFSHWIKKFSMTAKLWSAFKDYYLSDAHNSLTVSFQPFTVYSNSTPHAKWKIQSIYYLTIILVKIINHKNI